MITNMRPGRCYYLAGNLHSVKTPLFGRSPFYAVSVNCLYRDRVGIRDRVSGRVTDRVGVRRPDSSGNILIRRKMDYAPLFTIMKQILTVVT